MDWGQLFNGFSSKLGVVRIRSAMNPFVAILLIVALVFVSALKFAPAWCQEALSVLLFITVIVALAIGVYFAIVDPSRLQTEDHRYKMAALMQQNGTYTRIDGPYAENPMLEHMPVRPAETLKDVQEQGDS